MMDALIPDSFEMSISFDTPQDKKRLEKFFDRLERKGRRSLCTGIPLPGIARHQLKAVVRDLHRKHDAYVASLKLWDLKDLHAIEMADRRFRRMLRTSSAVPSQKPVHAGTREIARRLRQEAAA